LTENEKFKIFLLLVKGLTGF